MRVRSFNQSHFSLAGAAIAILLCATAASSQTSGFTYQGRLTDGGTAANGNYDLQFALFDSLSGGAQVGSTQTLNTVAVSNGVFTANLDFGANAFPGASRFLEISARPSGSGSFTLLTPRQPITSTPYAVRSLNAASADSVPASGVPAGNGNYIQNSSSPQMTSSFNISGNGTAGGTLSGNLVNATTQYNLNGSRILSNPGSQNLFAGSGAGSTNTTGSSNAFFGSNAGTANTTGCCNAFFGQNAGLANSTGGFNAFFGSAAGEANTTGGSNSFFGQAAGRKNIDGFANAFFGLEAGRENTNGNSNSFFGERTGASNTTGFSNSFFGRAAGGANTSGSENTFVGVLAGQNNITGGDNAFFGAGAGQSNTFGRFNAFFGEVAGNSNTGGDNNTAIGYAADVLPGPIFNPTNAAAIGYRAQVTDSNSLVLGSINGINGATADTKVGIGTTAPRQKLHVKGQGVFTADPATFDPGDGVGPAIRIGFDSNGGYGYINANNTGVTSKNLVLQPNNTQGNVGIGTTAPADRLHVFGDIRMGTSGTNGCLKRNDGTGLVGTCSSDLRFKRDITSFPSLLNKVTQLRPVHYYWRAAEFPDKGFGNTQGYGLVAQEVEQVLPELVSEDEQGYKLVDYSKLPLLLLQAVKEQQAQIAQQRELIERQRALADRQQQQLNALKKLTCRSPRRANECR